MKALNTTSQRQEAVARAPVLHLAGIMSRLLFRLEEEAACGGVHLLVGVEEDRESRE